MDSLVTPKGDLHGSAAVNTKGGDEGEKQSVENVVSLKPEYSMRIHHIDVGQGEATLIEFRVNQKPHFTILIDGGRYTRGGGTIVRYLRKLQITKIDIMICTHHDADHVEGLLRVLEDVGLTSQDKTKDSKKAIQVDAVIDRNATLLSSSVLHAGSFDFPEWQEEEPASGERFDEVEVKEVVEGEAEAVLTVVNTGKQEVVEEEISEADAEQLRKVLAKFQQLAKGKKTAALTKGMLLVESNTEPNFSMTCLHCNSAGKDDKQENNYSLAFLVQFGEFRYYTGGDLESGIEDNFIATLSGGKHLCSFKCGHHGSKHSTSDSFLSGTKASHAVISCGRHSYYHPDGELVRRLCKATDLRWFDLTNCYYNRSGVNPHYLTTEITLLQKMLPELRGWVGYARGLVEAWLGTVQGREGEAKVNQKKFELAEKTVTDLLGKVTLLVNSVEEAYLKIGALAGEDDAGCDEAFEALKGVKTSAEGCNTSIGASKPINAQVQAIQPGLDVIDAWNKEFEDMKAAIRRFTSIARACAQVVQRFLASKANPDPLKGYVAGAKGYLGTVVLDLSGAQAMLTDHQFAVGVYDGGWSWKPVRCLQTMEHPPDPLALPAADLSGAVEIKELKATNPGTPMATWFDVVDEMDPIENFSESTGASGSAVKKEPEPLSERELKERKKQEQFEQEASRLRQKGRNREQLMDAECALCGEDSSRGMTCVDCPSMDCGRPVALHRACVKQRGFKCPHCRHADKAFQL